MEQDYARPGRLSKRTIILIVAAVVVVGGAVVYYLLLRPDLTDRIVIPYISHQMPGVDPHLPSSTPLADKLDELAFDGLFNITAGPSGIIYEDGLGEFVGIDSRNVVTIRLKTGKLWHDSYDVIADGDKISVIPGREHPFTAEDLAFTLNRIQRLGSLSPDYILVSQAMETMGFDGPNEANEIRFKFRGDRIWKEADIKEILSFKILPAGSSLNAFNYANGTGPYLSAPPDEGLLRFHVADFSTPAISQVHLKPYVDNSTYTTEFRTGNINVLLETPFGSISPILSNPGEGFVKSNISTTFFAVLFNTQRLDREQRKQLRLLLDGKKILERFFNVGTPQQRNIVDYKGNTNNYNDYLNTSVFPSTSYYIEEEVIDKAAAEEITPDLSILPDTVRIKACMNSGFREEYAELINILNDPSITRGRVRVTAVPNEDLRRGDYDAVLVAFSGYRSTFLFDLYNIFLREPDLDAYRINLVTDEDHRGNPVVSLNSFQAEKNFFRLDSNYPTEAADIRTLLEYIYAFMFTRQIGDKQEYARRVDALERKMALGAWLFSLPSLAYFGEQFDSESIDLYGVASQLSTIEKWKERPAQ